jgi:hypothetical protein
MRTKSSIRIMMTITMKLVPLMRLYAFRSGYLAPPLFYLFWPDEAPEHPGGYSSFW